MNKTLIIKTGYSEILDKENDSQKSSLGDVLRTTVLLHLFKKDYVTWLTDAYAFPLLVGNPMITRLLPYNLTAVLQLQSEEFDRVINLEKIPGICALSDKIRARRNRYGFTFNSQKGIAEAYDRAYDILTVSSNIRVKRENKKTAQELLFNMVGSRWKGEEYVLSYNPKTSECHDVGLNTKIGQKWPTKQWPKERWDELENKLEQEGYSVSRQDKQGKEILENLNNYMDWINSCKMIVSNDSLGLHLAIAMKKKSLGLFGPTPNAEVHFYGLGKAITPSFERFPCLPCFLPVCKNKEYCMNQIEPAQVLEEVRKLYNR